MRLIASRDILAALCFAVAMNVAKDSGILIFVLQGHDQTATDR